MVLFVCKLKHFIENNSKRKIIHQITGNQQKETDAEPKSVLEADCLEEPENTIIPDLYVMDENGQYHFKSDLASQEWTR